MAVSLAACSGSPSHETPDAPAQGAVLQMNDISILLPLSSSYLAASTAGPRGVLLPQALYDAVGHIAGSGGSTNPGGSGDAAYSDLHVVAIRLDPCFAALAPDPHGSGCTNQLRLVVQEVKTTDGHPTAFDSALHVFYQLSRDELVALANQIAALAWRAPPANGSAASPRTRSSSSRV